MGLAGFWRKWAFRAGVPIPRAAVLMYHRVASYAPDPHLLCVPPDRFEAHIRHIREHYHPASLDQLTEGMGRGVIKPRSVAVTFDDGYLDNLTAAWPILRKYGVPATIFVATGFTGGAEEMPHDRLERILLGPARMKPELVIRAGGAERRWPIGPPPAPGQWLLMNNQFPTGRHKCYAELQMLVRSLAPDDRDEAFQQLEAHLEEPSAPRPDRRLMTEGELREISADGLVTLGGHTRRHVELADHDAALLESEIADSRTDLERMTGRPARHFAYPYGGPRICTPENRERVRRAGYQTGWDTRMGTVEKDTDRFAAPRFGVRNWDEEGFARRLRKYFEGFVPEQKQPQAAR